MKYRTPLVLAAAALFATANMASAKEVLGVGTPDAQQFRAKASASDAFEILSSRIALTHATAPGLKSFAQMMIHDHTKSSNRLVAIGGMSKASLEAKMKAGADGKYAANDLIDSSHADELNSLNSKSSTDFDKTYIDDQVKGHEDAVSLLEDYAKSGDNKKLKKFAASTLPTVKMHLDKARRLQKTIEHSS
jgi:putative membrane protein